MSTTSQYVKHHGLASRTEDSQRAEGWKTGEVCVWTEARTTDGSPPREEAEVPESRDRIIWITNTSQRHPPFVCHEINHTSQIVTAILERIPQLNLHVIGLRMSPQQMGTCRRSYVNGYLSYDITDIYVELYLKKHSGI
jgi:hypothetical protein